MRIIFLCGSIEIGADGVGDYSRILAAEMIKQGHHAGIVALYDRNVSDKCEETQNVDDIKIPVCRIPAHCSSRRRFSLAKEWIFLFNPDWISLQFVIFTFHQKGLPFGISRQLLNLGNQRRWHIMFHELWLGMDINATRKNRLWGWFQKNIIKKVIQDLKPALIHTQSHIYQAQLTKLGFDTDYLPLFGNIPNIKINHSDESVDQINSDRTIRLVHFASVHAGAPVDEFAREVARYSNEMDIPVSLTFIGRSGAEQNKWIEAFRSQRLIVQSLGELSPASISEFLNSSTMGISSTPVILAEKSGSVAAMREHGLPVLSVAYPWIAPKELGFEPIPGVFQYRNGIFKELLESKKKYDNNSSAATVSSKLAVCFMDEMNRTS